MADYAVNRAKQGKSISNEGVTELLYKNIADQAHGFFGVKGAIDAYNNSLEDTNVDTNKLVETIGKSNSALGKFLTNLKKTDGSFAKAENGIVGYGISLVGATAKTIALEVATTALNSAISFGISFAIQGLITLFDEWIVTSKELSEKVEEITSNFKEQKAELQKNKQTFEELVSSYEKLSKGVNSLGENVSLSTDKFEEYKNVTNQIAEIIPSTVKGWDAQGNAILNVGSNIDELIAKYNELIIAENNTVLLNGKDIFKDFKNEVNKIGKTAETLNKNGYSILKDLFYSDDVEAYYTKLFKTNSHFIKIDGIEVDKDDIKQDIASALNQAGIEQDFWESNSDFIKRAIKENGNIVKAVIADYEKQLNDAVSGVKSLAEAYISNQFLDGGYKNLDFSMQNLVSQMVSSFDTEFYSQFDNQQELYDYLDDMLKVFSQLDDNQQKQLTSMFAIQTQFNNGEITVAEYEEKLKAFLTLIDKFPEDQKKSILLLFGIETNEDGTTTSDFDATLNKVKEKFGKTYSGFQKEIGQLTLDELKILADLDISPKGIESWEEVESLIANAVKEAKKIDVSLDSYKKASEGVSSLSTAFKELTDSEYVSLDTISKIKEAVGDSVSNWDAYEQKLLSVKKGTAEYNQLMRELTYATLEKQLGGVNALANANEKYVAQLLKENGVLNANEVAHSAVERAKAKELIQSKTSNQETVKTIESLIQEANSAGISTNAYLELTAKEILFNNNNLDTSQKCQQILAIANAAGIASTAYNTLTSQIETWAGAKLGSGTRTDTATKLGMTVINEKNRGKDGKGKGNLYIASDGKEFEEYKDAMYYQESLNNVSKISNAYSNTNFVLPDYSGSTSGTSKETKETFDHIQTKISRLQRSITNFGKTVSATWKSWTDRNSALKSQISAVTSEINLQQQAADKYWALAESVSGVGNYKGLIQKGALDISTVRDENTINAIKQYQEYYNAYLDCLDAKQDAEDELANLVREDFDMIAKQFDSEISLVEANIGTLEAYIDQTEMKGNLVSKNYYSAMYKEEEKNLASLRQKYEQLTNKLSDGSIAQGTQEFNEMATEIKEVNKAIIESNTALEEYQKTMRELDWEVFDLIEEKIGNVTEESEFLIDLLSNSKLFNDDGSITSQGQATLGLHVANMKIYESQISDYAQSIADLDKEFANDSLDQNYLERREELVSLQRDMILQAQEEKNSIKDLMSEGYDSLLSYMDELIAKRKSLLSQVSDARSFQKTVQEQTDEINRLQAIISSYGDSLSEEDKSIVQKHQVSLEKAESDLEDTLLDKQLEEEQKMLDMLADESNQFVSEILDNTNGLIQSVVDSVDKNSGTIEETLKTEVGKVGGSISTELQNIWSNTDGNGIKGVVGGVNNTLLEIKTLVQSMVKSSDTETSKNASGVTSDVKPATKPATTPQSTPATTQQSSTKAITVGGLINAGNATIYSNANGGGGGRQFYRANPIYTVLGEKNNFLKVRHSSLSSGTTGWFKKSDVKAYKTGGLVDYTGLAWVDGQKGKPEAFLNANDTELFSKLKDSLEIVSKTNMFDAIQSYAKLPNFVPNNNGNKNVEIHFENMTFPNVKNADDFITDLQHSKRFENIILEITDGKGDLSKYKW